MTHTAAESGRRTHRRGLAESTRLEAFSDGVFAIVITLLVLDLKAPEERGQVLAGLAAQWPVYLAYLASFAYIGVIWVNHHQLFSRVAKVDLGFLWRNLALLLTISVLPFPTAVVGNAFQTGDRDDQRVALVLYAVAGAATVATWLGVRASADRGCPASARARRGRRRSRQQPLRRHGRSTPDRDRSVPRRPRRRRRGRDHPGGGWLARPSSGSSRQLCSSQEPGHPGHQPQQQPDARERHGTRRRERRGCGDCHPARRRSSGHRRHWCGLLRTRSQRPRDGTTGGLLTAAAVIGVGLVPGLPDGRRASRSDAAQHRRGREEQHSVRAGTGW